MADDINISEKIKVFLGKKLDESLTKIKKLKSKRKIIKILYYISIISSVSISVVIASLTNFVGIPIIIITILSTFTGVLTALSAKFNLENRKIEINKNIDNLSKLRAKLDYVISCNGDLTKEEYEQILKDFNF